MNCVCNALLTMSTVSNGNCASTCAMFSTLMVERLGTTVAVFGGKPGENVEYKGMRTSIGLPINCRCAAFIGMAGNQVLEWADLDTEIKTANLKNVSGVDYALSSEYQLSARIL